MKKKWLWIGIGAALLVAVVAINIARDSKGKAEPVQMARVRVEDITSLVRAPGKIEPPHAGQDQRRHSGQGRAPAGQGRRCRETRAVDAPTR